MKIDTKEIRKIEELIDDDDISEIPDLRKMVLQLCKRVDELENLLGECFNYEGSDGDCIDKKLWEKIRAALEGK